MFEAFAALALPPTAYQRALAAVERFVAVEGSLPLQPGTQTRVWLHRDRPSRGTLVMYHGFTAGTWQFDRLAPLAHEAGYNVLVPRLPGHGLRTASGDEDPSAMPTGRGWKAYQVFGDQTMALARGLGGPIGVLGLSVGGNVALDVAERHEADVDRVVAYAPFLWPRHERVSPLFALVRGLDAIFPGRGSTVLDRQYHSWGPQCRADTLSGVRPGHSYFPASAAWAAADYGIAVEAAAPSARAALQLFVTGADDAAEEAIIRRVHDRWGGSAKGIFRYATAEGIPHPMLHPSEDKGKGHTPALYQATLQFLERGEPVERDAVP